MRYFIFIVGLLMGAMLAYFFINPPPKEVIRTIWKERIVSLPSQVDTVQVVKTRYIEVPKSVEKTVFITKVDTVIIRDTVRVVISAFDYSPPEFDLSLQCYAAAKVDSVAMRYKMKENYINRILNSRKPEKSWHKYAWFGAGAMFTGAVVFLVK